MKMISLTENGKPVLLNPEHIMYIGKGVNHAGQEVDIIVLTSGMGVKPDDIRNMVMYGFEQDEAKAFDAALWTIRNEPVKHTK